MERPLVVFGIVALLGLPARAEVAPLSRVDMKTVAQRHAARLSSIAARAVARGEYARALAAAEQGLVVQPRDPWLHYNRGVALAALGRLDDAIASLRVAEDRFPVEDIWGRSVAIYQRGIKLQQAGRCDEAAAAFMDYAALLGDRDPAAVQQAWRYAADCPQRPRRLYGFRSMPAPELLEPDWQESATNTAEGNPGQPR